MKPDELRALRQRLIVQIAGTDQVWTYFQDDDLCAQVVVKRADAILHHLEKEEEL